MSNDAKKISELAVASTLSSTDRVVILANPNTSSNVKTITVSNFANSLAASNVFPVANSTQYGLVQVDGTTIISTNGVISASANIGNFQFVNNNINLQTPNNTNVYINPTGFGSVVVPTLATGDILLSGSVVPTANGVYNLGTSNNRFHSLWLSGNSIVFADTNPAYPDQTLTVEAGVFNILANGFVSNAGLRVGNFTFQEQSIKLSNTSANIDIGTLGAIAPINFNRAINVRSASGLYDLLSVNPNGLITITSNVVQVSTKGALEIIISQTGTTQSPNNTGVVIHTTGLRDAPARIYNDSYGNSYSAYIGRRARGTSDTPTQTMAGDTISRIGANPYGIGGFSGISTMRVDFVNREDQTSTNMGGELQFWTTANGSNTITKRLTINENGTVYADGTTQNTAFNSTSAVTSISVGTGLTRSGSSGNVSLNATGVLTVTGTTNQVIVANVGQNITLSLPQSISTNSTVQFGVLTVNNFTVTGTSTISGTASVSSKIYHLAYDSTANTQIDGGGFTLGNTSSSYYVSFLYDLTNNRWDTGTTNFKTTNLVANTFNVNTVVIQQAMHVGNAYIGYDYPGATVQVDCNNNSYNQIIAQNHSAGSLASTDFVATNDIGNDNTNYVDLGINSSTYNGTGVGWTISGPNDSYLYTANGNLTIGTASPGNTISFHTGGTLINNIRATINDSGLAVTGNVSATNFSGTFIGNLQGTANNTSFVGTVSAANVVSNAQLQANLTNYQTTIGLSANVAMLTANAATYVNANSGIVSNSSGVFVNTSYISTLPASIANNTNFVGTVSAANVVSNAQLQSNLAAYQTILGLSANVVTMISNNTSYVGTIPASNVVSTSQLSGNLANYVTTSGLSANVAALVPSLTSNNTNFVGTVSAANVVSNAQLQANLANYVTNLALSGNLASYVTGTYLTSTLLNYQTSAGLSANVLTLTSNNTNFVGNVFAANVVSNAQLQANLTGYVNTSGNYTFNGVHTYIANISINTLLANGVAGTNGQVLTANSVDGALWATLNTYKTKKTKHKDGSFDPDINAGVLQDTMTYIDGAWMVMNSNTASQTITVNHQFTPRNAGAVTAITINFANDDLVIYNQGSSASTISFQNYTAGRNVVVLVQSGSGPLKNITTGLTANQSNFGATTLTPANAGATVRLEYYCTNTSIAGVFVAN